MPAIPQISVVTPSAELPITLAQVKSWLKIDDSGNDDKLTIIMKGAVEQLERYIRRPIIDKTILFTRSEYQYDCEVGQEYIDLPYPIGSLSSVTIYDKNNDDTVVVSEFYDNRVILGDYSIDTRENHAYVIEFVSGIAEDAMTCPFLIKSVLLEMCAKIYEGTCCSESDLNKIMSNVSSYVNYIQVAV